jgi:hypothetical protein
VTVALGLLLAVAAAYCFVTVGLSAFIADSCADVRCDFARFDVGLLIGLVGPPVVLVAATVVAFRLRSRGRAAFVAPLVGFGLMAVVLFGALGIAYSAVPGASLF